MVLQDADAEGDGSAEPGASFISGRLAALEVEEGEEEAAMPLDAEAAAALRADLHEGLLAHAQGEDALLSSPTQLFWISMSNLSRRWLCCCMRCGGPAGRSAGTGAR